MVVKTQQGDAGRVPEIPQEFRERQEMLGTVPAECAAGFEATRIANTPEAIAELKNRGQVVVRPGDRNPDDPSEALIRNEEIFAKTPEGYLSYRGDLVVVWRTSYAETYRQREAQRAQAVLDGMKIRRVPLAQAMVPPSVAEVTAEIAAGHLRE